jgi:hypothetical protein
MLISPTRIKRHTFPSESFLRSWQSPIWSRKPVFMEPDTSLLTSGFPPNTSHASYAAIWVPRAPANSSTSTITLISAKCKTQEAYNDATCSKLLSLRPAYGQMFSIAPITKNLNSLLFSWAHRPTVSKRWQCPQADYSNLTNKYLESSSKTYKRNNYNTEHSLL